MKQNKILFIDGWNVMLAQNAVSFISDGNGNPIGMYLTTLNMVRTFIDRFKPSKVVFVLDGPNAGERRRKLLPTYKNGRRITARKSKVIIMEGEENQVFGVEGEFQNQLIKIYDFLKLLPVTVAMVPYCEADDMIAYLALKNKSEDTDCIIISNDRDYLQLAQDGIMVYRWKEKRLYDTVAIEQTFGVKTENFIFRKIILGDVGDNIKDVKGVGEKTFIKLQKPLTENICNDMSDLYSLLENMDYSECNTRERNAIKKLLLQKDAMNLAYRLMKLDESCMMVHHRDLLTVQIQEQLNKGFSRLSCKLKMQSNYFNKLYPGFNDERWLQPFSFLKPGVNIYS